MALISPPEKTTSSRRFRDSDLWYSFRRSPTALIAAAMIVLIVGAALLAPLIAPHDPFDLATVNLMDAQTPPMSVSLMGNYFALGSDIQGRDVLSTILYGSRTSLFVAVMATGFALIVGLTLGIVAGYFGGAWDSAIMRIVDVQLSFPAILIALLVFGVTRGFLPAATQDAAAVWVLIFSIGLSNWAQFARTVRGATLVERQKDYVSAAHMMGTGRFRILFGHILPNVISPVMVIATLGLAVAVIEEATLSYLGVGVPPTQASLGTLIRIGQQFLFSGEWWILFFPALVLVLLTLSVNLLGDWLRDALNPRLK
ncbi:ABC transporter permease [Pseudotabrizicola sp. 4114]|uniref:ABC transporter permease n=1 Tax=Pseudotabrizicola sp. 4114 TaxID=2817731 RepID=UPI00285D2BAB|nr:peptide/nickel transport system permease protein [Pseudorhodobacter sp. 4114]